MKNKFFKLSVATVLMLSKSAFAATIYAECDYCSTPYSFQAKAEAISYEVGGRNNTVFVENKRSLEVQKYKVITFLEEPGMPIEISVSNLAMTQDEKATFSKLQSQRDGIQRAFTNLGDVPTDIADSAYDLVGNSSRENRTIDWYRENANIDWLISDHISLALSTFSIFNSPNVIVDITFKDGSVARFKITGVTTLGKLTYKMVSAIDANKNNIPLTKEGYTSGSFNFTNDPSGSLSEFIDAASRMGIPITGGIGGATGGIGGAKMTCKEIAGNLECVITYQIK
ncbi:hypothetical protein [Shewanella mangrovisoli]|uniref:hypothetical protein n=1 Tax=Shewanella mangrovisoli TaxID=2864211 RepID=UPI0035B6E944